MRISATQIADGLNLHSQQAVNLFQSHQGALSECSHCDSAGKPTGKKVGGHTQYACQMEGNCRFLRQKVRYLMQQH